MFDFVEKLMLARLIELEKGKISLMGQPVNIIPTDILIYIQKTMIRSVGIKKTYEVLYESTKKGAMIYCKEFIKKYNIKNFKEILEWYIKIVTLAGWGDGVISYANKEKSQVNYRLINSPFCKNYGQTNYPICFIQCGFGAGGLSILFNKNIDIIETKCASQGHKYCEFEGKITV